MKKFLVSLFFAPIVAFAIPTHTSKDVICEEASLVLQALAEEYGEQIIVLAQGTENVLLITMNKETGTYSVFEDHNGQLCGLNLGEHFTINWKAMPTKPVSKDDIIYRP
jgi:hypothetical protein